MKTEVEQQNKASENVCETFGFSEFDDAVRLYQSHSVRNQNGTSHHTEYSYAEKAYYEY